MALVSGGVSVSTDSRTKTQQRRPSAYSQVPPPTQPAQRDGATITKDKPMQVTPTTPYSEIATNANTGLNAPSYEDLAATLERAQAEIDEYGEQEESDAKRIETLEAALEDADRVLNSIDRLHQDGEIELAETLVQQLHDAITVIDNAR